MPSVSKAQQRFMGLVHAYKNGEVPASKVSQAVKDAAKSMKKKSTKKFASTKHDDLPNKVRSENMNEDGHTDVASAERKLKLIMKDAMDTLNALRNLSNEDSLPSWWTDKITLAKDYVGKSRDYIMNPAESVNEESKTIKSIQNLADKNKYGTVSGTRMNGKTAKEIIAIYNHPKMKSFKGKMDKLKSHELMDLTIRLPKMLGIKVESVNEISSYGEYVEDNARMLAQDYRRQDKKLAKALDHVADRINQSYPGRNRITKNDVKDIIKQPYDRKLMRPMMRFNLDDLFESVNETPQKVAKLLIKYGNNTKDVKDMIKKHYKKAKKDRSKSTPSELANYISFLSANESVSEGKKRYYQQDRVGSAKYTISYHDGKKKHKDGSDFFDIKIFKNKKDLAKFVNTLSKSGYVYGFNESVNEVSGVDVAKKVLKNKQMEKGLDLQTANLIVTIDKAYDKNPRLQKKFRAIKLPKMKQLILKFGR